MDSPTLNLKLIIEKGPRKGEVLEFNPKARSSIQVGRVVRGNTISIKEDGISSKHLSICFAAGKWVVSDLNSSNGTKLNSTSLDPLTNYDLRDGDVIKIGEFTSIRVQFICEVSGAQLRRNNKRGGAPEYPQVKGLGEAIAERAVAETRVRGSTRENVTSVVVSEAETKTLGPETGQENVQGVLVEKEEKRRGRGRPKRACNLKDGNFDDMTVPVSSDAFSVVSENAEDVRRRLRSRKKNDRSLKKDEEKGEVLKVGEVEKADAPPQRRLRSRNQKGDMNMTLSSELKKMKKVEAAEAEKHLENVEVQKIETRARGRRKKNEQGTAPHTAGSSSLGTKDEAKEMNKSEELRKYLIDGLEENDDQQASQLQLDAEELKETNADSVKSRDPDSKTRGLISEALHCGLDAELGLSFQESGSNRQKDNEDCEDIDLEKMTLGEWFDYLERYIPKQINAVTDQVITDLRQRSQQFHEFMVHRQKEEENLPMG